MALPGVRTVIRDRFYILSRTNIPQGILVLIVGRRNSTSIDVTLAAEVADLDVYIAASEKDVIDRFGAESDLHRGYIEAVAGGATRIALVPLPEDTVFDHTNGYITSATWDASGAHATPSDDDLFDDAFAAVESAQPDIVVLWGRGAGPTEYQDPATPGDDEEFGFHADNSTDPTKSWAVKVADKMESIVTNSKPAFAVLGVKPYVGAATSEGSVTPAAIASHFDLSNLVDKSDTGLDDTGPYLSIVVAEIKTTGYERNYTWGYANGAAQYAGAIAQLDAWSSPTGKYLFNVSRVRYNPTRTQQQTMVDKGVVPVALNYSNIPVWVDAQTFADEGSDYRRLTTLRIVFDAVSAVRQVAQSFIGEAATIETRNALEAAITKALMGMQQLGALLASDFAVTYDAANNSATIEMVLTPAFELRSIEVTVAVDLG